MRSRFVLRTRILCGCFIAVALLLAARLYFVQIVHGQEYVRDAQAQYEESTPDTEDRGNIYFTSKDGELVPAAVMQNGWRIAIDPQSLGGPSTIYGKLNGIVPVDHDRFFEDAAKKNSTYQEVAFRVTDSEADAVRALDLPGVMLVADQWRYYPAGVLASHVLGFVGYTGTSTSRSGVYGLEKSWEDTLDETSGGLYVNPFAEIFTNLQDVVTTDPSAHQGSIVTSIDPQVQLQLEKTLDQVMQTYTPQFSGGIIMDPHTGEIVAMAARPTFDPNTYNTVSDASVFSNPLVQGRYELGSIMKPLTMAAGLDSGAITTQTTYADTGCISVSGAKICNYDFKARGVIPMQTILDQSLNVGASWVATKTGYPTFTAYMRSYFGQKTGIDLPGEVQDDISTLDNGSGPAVNFDTASFGQGISITPISMIRALSAIANGGVMPVPHTVTAIKYDSGITRGIAPEDGTRVFATSTAETVTHMLEHVYDTALGNGIYKMDHYTGAAKTGTAQIPAPGGGYLGNNTFLHSFFGFFPASQPRFIIFLFAYEPHGVEYASASLAPSYFTLEQFLINYYDIPPDR